MDWLADFFELIGDAIDVNDDGLINVSDLSEGVTNLVDNAGDVINVQTLQQTIFNYIDKNGTVQIETEDFIHMVRDHLDKNNDGQVTSIDFRIHKMAIQIGDNYGPLAKIAFKNAIKFL